MKKAARAAARKSPEVSASDSDAPFLVEARHPHWAGPLRLDPASMRACLIASESHASYTLTGDRLELAWDHHPADVFSRQNGVFVHLALLSGQDQAVTNQRMTVEIPQSKYIAELRTTGSDVAVYYQVFIHNEYASEHLPEAASVVVDLGANIGMGSLFFAARYPSASIISIEPDPENFALLSRNIAQTDERVVAVQAAIWGEDQALNLKTTDSDGSPLGAWGFQVEASAPDTPTLAQAVTGWSMGRLIGHFGLRHIDILKIDVEGAEKELFEAADLSWLKIVDMILIETHERFRPGCNAAVLKLLEHGFDLMQRSGENEIFVKRTRGRFAVPQPQSGRYAIITAYYKEDPDTLMRCMQSVRDQTFKVDHILVADGFAQTWIDGLPVRHIKLDHAHGDYGNTPRGVGALLAISEGYDGIGFIDADNWLESDHVASCVRAEQDDPEADFVIARWNLRRPNGTILPLAHDPSHVDTNCFFFLPGSFHMLPHFHMMPKELSIIGDRVFYAALKGAALKSVSTDHPTVNYSCLWPTLYRMAGEEPPPEAKPDIDASSLAPWLNSQTPRAREIIGRRAGVHLF